MLCFFLFSTCCCDCPPPTGTENDSSWPLPLNMVHPLLQGECSQEPRRSPRSIPAFRSSSLDTRSACPCSHGTANPVAGPPALGTVSPENFLLVLFRDSSGLCLSPAVSCGGDSSLSFKGLRQAGSQIVTIFTATHTLQCLLSVYSELITNCTMPLPDSMSTKTPTVT